MTVSVQIDDNLLASVQQPAVRFTSLHAHSIIHVFVLATMPNAGFARATSKATVFTYTSSIILSFLVNAHYVNPGILTS